MENKRVHLLIHGRVQGVFFRASAQQKAQELELSGWVRNNSDGSVEIMAEGEGDRIDSIIEWCRIGPAQAVVKHVSINWEPPEGESQDFRIEYI